MLEAMFYVCFFTLLIILTYLVIEFSKERSEKVEKIAKILSIVLVCIFFVNIFLPDLFAIRGLGERIGIVNGTQDYSIAPADAWISIFDQTLGRGGEVLHTFARVGLAIVPVSIPFAIFFKKKQISRVVTFIVIPFILLNACLFFQYNKMFTFNDPSFSLNDQLNQFGDGARTILQNGVFRSIWFGIGLLLSYSLALYVAINNWKTSIKFEGLKDVFIFIGIIVAFIFTNMPIYTAQHLFHSYSKIILTLGYPGHFIFIGLICAEAVVLYFLLRKQSYENKYIVMFIMAISLLMQYNTFFKTDGIINASRWPFQLCNIAGAFIIVTLLTKSEKMFHFTLVVNSLGALIAIAICDSTFNTGIFYEMNVHYMVEHINVLLVPILCGLLKVFKPLKKKDVFHVMIGFAIYWGVIMVVGTILCSLQTTPLNSTGFFDGVNYLFMFNAERSAQLLGFSKPLFNINFSIGKANFSLAQIVILIVFEALCVGVYFAFYSFLKEKRVSKKA